MIAPDRLSAAKRLASIVAPTTFSIGQFLTQTGLPSSNATAAKPITISSTSRLKEYGHEGRSALRRRPAAPP